MILSITDYYIKLEINTRFIKVIQNKFVLKI